MNPLHRAIEAVVERFFDKARFFGMYLYQVVEEQGVSTEKKRPDLRAVNKVPGLPNLLVCDKVHGLAGAYEELPLGAKVVVGFIDGDPAQPAIMGFLSAVPIATEFQVATKMTVKQPAGVTQPVAVAPPLVTWTGQVQAVATALKSLLAISTFVPIPPATAAQVTPLQTALIATLTALELGTTTVQGNAPNGIISTTLETT